MKIARVLERHQRVEPGPVQGQRAFDEALDLQGPPVQRDDRLHAQVEHGETRGEMLPRRQAVVRAHGGPFPAGLLARPAFLALDDRVVAHFLRCSRRCSRRRWPG